MEVFEKIIVNYFVIIFFVQRGVSLGSRFPAVEKKRLLPSLRNLFSALDYGILHFSNERVAGYWIQHTGHNIQYSDFSLMGWIIVDICLGKKFGIYRMRLCSLSSKSLVN